MSVASLARRLDRVRVAEGSGYLSFGQTLERLRERENERAGLGRQRRIPEVPPRADIRAVAFVVFDSIWLSTATSSTRFVPIASEL